MTNRNYNSGRAFEWAIVRTLKGEGYEATRSAGSHGLWDVVGVSKAKREVIFVQAKRVKRGGKWKDDNVLKFTGLASAFRDVVPEGFVLKFQVWVKYPRASEPTIIEL